MGGKVMLAEARGVRELLVEYFHFYSFRSESGRGAAHSSHLI